MILDVPLFIFPVGVVLVTPMCCFLPYLLAVYYSHCHPWLPYISDTGGVLPQSSLFSQLMDINALMIGFSVFLRYKIDEKCVKSEKNESKRRLLEYGNNICLILGLMISFGTVIMGNYRMTELKYGHGIGVVLGFGSGVLYLIAQGFLSYYMQKSDDRSKWLATIRLSIGFLTLFSVTLLMLFALLSFVEIGFDKFWSTEFRLHWSPPDPGYHYHWLSTLFEWIAVLSLSPYFLTYLPDFKTNSWNSLRQSETHFDSNSNTINL